MPSVAVYCSNAFFLTVAITLLMAKLAPRVGLVDIPDGRKRHEGRIPLVGSGVFIALLGTGVLLPLPGAFAVFFISTGLIVGLGVVDDLVDLRASIKFIAQCIIVAILVQLQG